MVTLDQAGRAGDAIEFHAVPVALRPWVEDVFTIDFRGVVESDWKVMPDTSGHLLVHLPSTGGDRVSVRLVGARARSITTDVSGRAWTVGVRFRPGGLAALCRESATVFTDRSACPEDVWGAPGRDLVRRVDAPHDVQRVRASVLGALSEQAANAAPVDWRVAGFAAWTREARGRLTVAAAAARMGVAPRTLRATAHDRLGLSPKRYARVQRLLGALALAPGASWAERAALWGFADQSHLVRECRDLLGETPSRFAARRMPKRSSAPARATASSRGTIGCGGPGGGS